MRNITISKFGAGMFVALAIAIVLATFGSGGVKSAGVFLLVLVILMFVAGGAAGPGSPARKAEALRRDARPRRRRD